LIGVLPQEEEVFEANCRMFQARITLQSLPDEELIFGAMMYSYHLTFPTKSIMTVSYQLNEAHGCYGECSAYNATGTLKVNTSSPVKIQFVQIVIDGYSRIMKRLN
jgi:hypothetical protein